jgi:enolase
MSKIKNIVARQIFDSRGNPTVETDVYLQDGTMGRASVPSGASTGKYEAFELRDNKKSYHGRSVLKAVENINVIIFDTISGLDSLDQNKIDRTMIELDGSKNKSKLGANALLSVSLAVADAASKSLKLPLYKYIGGSKTFKMPVPMLNVINGGAHANNNLSFQEFMIIPVNEQNFSNCLRKSSEVFHTLKYILEKKGLSTAVGDEGGFAPDLENEEDACKLLKEAIIKSGYKLGKDFMIGLDVASSEFYKNKRYKLQSENKSFTGEEFSKFLINLCKKYEIISLEDPFSEDDWNSWIKFTKLFGDRIQIVGDDLFATNLNLINKGIENRAANAVLIKPNQIGTLTETMDAIELAQSNGYETVISHRSGETENTFISDLAVATNSGQIKTGSMSRSERIAKFNQLLRIEENFTIKKSLKNNKFY